MSRLTVSKLAGEAGISADAVRYYERIGLLAEPERSPSGYRLYDAAAIERLRFIKGSQRLGLRLEEIGELLDIRERGLCPCGHRRGLLERRVAQLEDEMAALARVRDDINAMLDELPESPDEAWQCATGIRVRPKRKVAHDHRHPGPREEG